VQLGQILSDAQELSGVGLGVEFHVSKRLPSGALAKTRVKATLWPVSETDRAQARESAREYLLSAPDSPHRRALKDEASPISMLALEDEITRQFLRYALRDAERPAQQLISDTDYPLFRNGVVMEQIEWLMKQYKVLLQKEYPEVFTEEDREALEGAAGES